VCVRACVRACSVYSRHPFWEPKKNLQFPLRSNGWQIVKVKRGSPYSITERRVPEVILVLGSQHAGDVSHKPGGRLPLLSARPVTSATLERAATSFAAW